MPKLSDEGNQLVQELAQRHGLSTDAVTHMLVAVHNGSGQWMRGGMTMVSDLFNNQLKCQVDNLCNDISNALATHQIVPFSGSFQSQSPLLQSVRCLWKADARNDRPTRRQSTGAWRLLQLVSSNNGPTRDREAT